MADRRSQAQRVVEYHQAHIADHLLRCAGAGNEKPFRHTLSNSVEPTRRPSPFQQQREYLLSGEKPRHGKEVQPVLRLRQPRGGRSCPPSILGAAGATAARISPRLPPLVYEGIDSSLAGQRLPAAWFAEPPPLEDGQVDMQRSCEEEPSQATSRSEGNRECKTFDPPLRAKGVYHLPDGRSEWRPCCVLAHEGDQFLIQWNSGRQKKVSSLQLRFEGETEAEAQRRHQQAEDRRDTVEAMMLEQVVVEELSRWQLRDIASGAVTSTGASVQRIMDLAQLQRYEASNEVVQGLIGEAAEAYCRSQAKWLLLWRRPDLKEYLGVKPVPPRSPPVEAGSEPGMLEDVSIQEPEPPKAEPPKRPRPRPRPKEREPSPDRGGSKGPGGVRGNLAPNRKFRNAPSAAIVEKSTALAANSLLGKADLPRLIQVFNVVGLLYCESCVQLYCPVRKREPYSLPSFSRSLVDGFSRSSSFYRISWPESITLFFMSETGVISRWTPRISGLVARLMEASLHHLCLQNLQKLLVLVQYYAHLTQECREGKMLTYMPPPVYQRMAVTNYEQHPLFRIQVVVERNGAAGEAFVPSFELAVESFFSSADSKSLDIIMKRHKFGETVQHVKGRWQTDTAKQDLLPDGSAHGGAPSANNLALLRNTAHMVAQLASVFGGPVDRLESEDEVSVDELVAEPSRHQDIRVLLQAGHLEVKLSAHPTEFREVLGDHFRKVVELTEKYTTIDGSLQQEGEVKQQFLAGLSSVQNVSKLREDFEEHITSCFFQAPEVVYEVQRYQALLQRFGRQEEQLRKMLHIDLQPEAHSPDRAEGEDSDLDEASEVASQSLPDAENREERFALGIVTSIDELRDHLDRIDSWAQELNEAQDLPERHLGLFVVDVTPLRKALLAMCACCRLRLLGVVQRWLEDACAKLKSSLQVKSGEIVMSPKQPDELHSAIEAVKSLDPFLMKITPVLASIRQMFEVLESRFHQVPRALIKRWYECIHAVPDVRDRAEKWRNIFRKDLRGKFNMKIAEKAKVLLAQVEECRLVLEEYACKVSLNKAEFYYNKMNKLQERVAKVQEQVEKQHVHEEMMEMPLSEFPGLAATAEQIAPLLELWYLAHEWIQWKDEILFGEFSKIDPNTVKQKLQTCTETMRRLEEVFATQPRPRQVLHSLSLELTELRVLLPVIVSLRNPGLRERHWTLIGEAIDQNIQANQMKEISLSVMNERYPFVAHLSKIQAISETASREMLIEEELRRMQDQWTKLTFQFQPGNLGEDGEWLEEETSSLMAQVHHPEVWELITEQSAKVRALGRRSHAAVHEKNLVAHDAKLKAIGELCDLIHESQYGYLCAREQLVQEGLVKDLMQRDVERNKEWKRFFDVEKQWQNILNHLKSSNHWLALLEVPKITAACREAAATMEHIQRSIHEVLDLRRAKVPHLYRLSDAALMRVIRYGHNPAEPAIRGCLPGVLALDVGASVMSEGKSVRGLVGDAGEYLSLPEELVVQEGMQIEEWLPKLISQMEHLLRWSLFGLMLSNFSGSDPRLLDDKYPLQVRSAALDLALTSEVESLMVDGNSTAMQERRLGLCQLIDQIQERQLQAADSEWRGVDFDHFMAGSSSEEEEEAEQSPTETEESEEEDAEEEEEEEEELTTDESLGSSEVSAPVAGGDRMAARKAVRLEPPVFGGPPRSSGARSSQASEETRGKPRRTQAAQALLPEQVLEKMPWRLLRISIAVAQQQLLRWREVMEELELERPEGHGKEALTSYRWLTTLRHYMRSKQGSGAPESYVDRGQYVLSMAGFDLGYSWQYLGSLASGRMYWDPQTERGQLVMVHALATARGVMSTGSPARAEAAAAMARQLGTVQEKLDVNWRSSAAAVWQHLEGAALAGAWLTISLDSSTHVQVLSALAQDLHSHLNMARVNLQAGATPGAWGWVTLECHQALLAPQRLPLLLLQAFRPVTLPSPSLEALCELWFLSSNSRPIIAKSTARLAAFAWRFCEASGLTCKRKLEAGCLPLWPLRILCETTAKLMIQVRGARRGGKGRVSSSVFNTLGPEKRTSGQDVLRKSSVTGLNPEETGSRKSSERQASTERRVSERRASGQGVLLGDTVAPSWARASLLCAFKLCFFEQDGVSELCKLMNVSQEDVAAVEQHLQSQNFELESKAALEELGLAVRPAQLQAVQHMNLWVNRCHTETDLCVGTPQTRAVLVLGSVAVGKSSCVDALVKCSEVEDVPWEMRRLNATSLALDASDALQRPGATRLMPPCSSMGILDQIEGKKVPRKVRKVLVHVDGEVDASLQGAFLSSLSGVSEAGSSIRHGLQFSKQSWLSLREGSLSRLAVAFEMGESSALSPDLLARCGVVHLGEEEDFGQEVESLVHSWCSQVETQFEKLEVGHTVKKLCEFVLVPLLVLAYKEPARRQASSSELLSEALRHLEDLGSAHSARRGVKKKPGNMKLSEHWALPWMPRRVLFLRVRDAFMALYGHLCKVQREGREQDPEVDQRRSRTVTDTHENALSLAAHRSPRVSRIARMKQEVDDLSEAPPSPRRTETGRRRSSVSRQVAQKVSSQLLVPEVEAAPAKEELALLDAEATVAFLFATISSFSALLHESALPVLEDAALRLMDLAGPQVAHVRLPVEFSILDSVPDEHMRNFYHVDSIVKEPEMADLDAYVLVPTMLSKRFLALASVLQRSQSPLLLLGPAGSGKSALLSQAISQLPLREVPSTLPAAYASHCGKATATAGFGDRAELLYMSAAHWIQPGRWERFLQSLTRTSQHGLRPRLYSWCAFVIDDCHCASTNLREAWRFTLERGLVHSPGAVGARKAEGGKRQMDRLEREAPVVSVRHVEGVMMILAARSAAELAGRHNFLRHTWLFNLEPLQEADLLKIVGDNMSHFIFVKDIAPSVVSKKMLYVRLVHGLQLKLQETQASTRLITPHVLFRFFKSLLSQPTECLCDLRVSEFHKFFLHELVRETVDRLPAPRQKPALLELAKLQRDIFGGMGADDEDSGEEETLNEFESEKLEALRFTSLQPCHMLGLSKKVQRGAYGEEADGLRDAVRLELRRGWERAKVIANEVSPMIWSLSAWGSEKERRFGERPSYSKGSERGCAGLEPRHLLLSDEYIRHILILGRFLELAAGGRHKVWARQGGKALLLAPSVSVALCLARGAAHLFGLGFDTPLGVPSSEGTDGGAGFQSSLLGLGLADSLEGAGMTGAAFRRWLKEKLHSAVTESSGSSGTLLCIPPALMEQEEILAELHEAFSQEGPPVHWFSEKEVKDCEDAVAALPHELRLVHMDLEEEDGESPPTLEIYWTEALGRVQFLLLASNEVPEERVSTSLRANVATLDAFCPGLLQMMAVLQMPPPSVSAYTSAAKIHLDSPILDLETWQPESPFKSEVEEKALAEAAAEMVRSAHCAALEPPAGTAPKTLRARQGLGCSPGAPRMPAQSSAWNGEVVDTGLQPPTGGLGDIGDVLQLAQGLCRTKGSELAGAYALLKDGHRLLQQLNENVALAAGSELSQSLAEATRSANEAQAQLEERKSQHQELKKQLTALLDQVVNNCAQQSNKVEAAEQLLLQTRQEIEANRFQLINFGKQEYAEMKKALNQHVAAEERGPVLALLELCCLLMRLSPTREEIKQVFSEPNFATRFAAMAGVDAETFPSEFLAPMAEAAAAAETAAGDVKALTILANMAFPAYQYTTTLAELPELQAELRRLEATRESRRGDVEVLQTEEQELASEVAELEAEAMTLQQALRELEDKASSATEQRSRTAMMSNSLRQDRIRWDWRLQELSRKLQSLVGDCLLSAAAAQLMGAWGPFHREDLMSHWKAILERFGVPYSKDFDLNFYWVPGTARCRWHSELALPQDPHLEESIVLSCLQATKWPLFYDPDQLAAGFLAKYFPGAAHLTMGSTDFQKDLMSALQRQGNADDVLGQVIIIDNAYLPAIRDSDILTELLSRRQMASAALGKGAGISISGAEESVVVDPRTVLVFITEMGEALCGDTLSANFSVVDFQLSREPQGSGPLLEMMTDTVCAKTMPTVHQELRQLQPEFVQLLADWQRQDDELVRKLAAFQKQHTGSEAHFPTEEQLRETMTMKMNLDSAGRRLLKVRDGEAKLLQQRSANDLLVACLCSLAMAADEIFSMCPTCNVSMTGAWHLCAELLPDPPEPDRKKGRGADMDYAALARRAVLSGLWAQLATGMPQQLQLAGALRLAVASAVPHRGLQELLGKLLMQCPAAEPQALLQELDGALSSTMQAVLRGRSMSEALQQFRPDGRVSPRPSFAKLAQAGSRSSSKRSANVRQSSKMAASLSRSAMSLGAFVRAEEEEEDVTPAGSMHSEVAPEVVSPPPGPSAELLAVFGRWDRCSSKGIFLARFIYFQEAFRGFLEQLPEENVESKDTGVVLSDLFRIVRSDLFGIDERYLEDLLSEVHLRGPDPTQSTQSSSSQRATIKDTLHRRSTRNLPMSMEGDENMAEGGADMAQLLSLLMHVFAMGHVAGPWQLQLHLDRQALQHLCDRVEDSMASSPGAWARWADMVACGGLRKGGIGFNQALIEHLPLLASLPHDLLTSLLPQPHLGSVTLKFTSAAAMLQTMLFTVLCSHSLAAVMGAAEAVVAGLTGNTAPLRRNRLPEMLQSSHTRPVLCLCDSEASSAVDNIHKLAQKEQRKVVQLSLTDLAASESKGFPGEVRGPAAQSCATPGAVLERLEECKDVGYWLVLHLQPGALRLAQAGCEAVGWQLLEWIWFNCSTPSFHSTADEKFRLFIIVDSRSPCALPTWLFRSRRGLCLFDSQTGLQLRAWLEHAVDCTRRSEQSPPVPVVPTVQAPSPSSSKAAAGKEFKNLADAANGSQLLSEGKMAKATSSPVLCSKLAQPNFPLKLQHSGLRVAMMVLAAACDQHWPRCVLKSRPIGGRAAEVLDDVTFDNVRQLRSVDVLEIFGPLLLQGFHASAVADANGPGPATAPVLYNLLRHIRQCHLSRLRDLLSSPVPETKPGVIEIAKRSSAARTSQLNVLVSRKTRKEELAVDEVMWYHDEHGETDTPWMAFVQVVDAIDRLSQDPDESAETQLQEALKILPLVDPMSALRSVGPCEAIFTLVLTFSSPSRGFLKLPQLPHEPLVREDSLLVREDSLLFQRESSQASPESEEKQKAEPRKVSGVEMLQIRIPELPQLPSEIGSCTEEESAEGALAKRIFEPMTQSVSRTALAELLKATLLCVETCTLSTSMRPNEGDTPLQAEWRRQRAAVAHWAWQIHGEARELLRGLEDGWDTMSQAAVMKLRHLLYFAELRASREPQDIKASAVDSSSCPPEVWLAAESAAAATLPVPHGWQQPNFREEETFGCWLAHLARQLHETYAPTAVPLRLRAADVAQVEPLLLSLRLALAARRNLAVEQTCLVFLPDGRAETEGSEAQSPTPEAESVQFWDELDSERPPCFKPACVLPAALVSGMAPLAARNAPSEAKSPSPEAAPAAASPEPQTSPSLEGAAASRSTLTLSRSVRKIQIMASLNKGRRSSVKSGKKARESKEGRFIHKELGTEDLILTGLLADGAVWSQQGLHIDSHMAGVTRLPPMRAVAATLRAGEYLMAACFPQATGCMNLFVHRLLGEEGVLPCSTELCSIRLPFWSKSWGRWQPVMLLDAPPCPALPGHLRGSEGLAKESLEELPLLARPFGLQPAALPALAGPPLLSRQTC